MRPARPGTFAEPTASNKRFITDAESVNVKKQLEVKAAADLKAEQDRNTATQKAKEQHDTELAKIDADAAAKKSSLSKPLPNHSTQPITAK